MITTPEIICDLFSFFDKDQIERVQLVNQFWNSVIIRHKNILPIRQFERLKFDCNEGYLIEIYASEEEKTEKCLRGLISYIQYTITFDGTNLSKVEENVSPRYSQLTVDEVLTNLNDVVFDSIEIKYFDRFENNPDHFLNMMKLVTAKTGGTLRGKFGDCDNGRYGSILHEIFDNYIIVDRLALDYSEISIRDVSANPEIVQLPLTPKEISISYLYFEENEEVLHFTCNGANRVTIDLVTSKINGNGKNYGKFIRQWFELYRTYENPISLVRKFEHQIDEDLKDSDFDAVKTFLNNTQLRVKYSLETTDKHCSFYIFFHQFVKRSCVLLETNSYALVIEMEYIIRDIKDVSSINASDLDQPPCDQMQSISFCVKSL